MKEIVMKDIELLEEEIFLFEEIFADYDTDDFKIQEIPVLPEIWIDDLDEWVFPVPKTQKKIGLIFSNNTEMNLSNTSINDTDMELIAEVLKTNNSLTSLNLNSNNFTSRN